MPLLTVEQLRAEHVTALRWWSPEELDASAELHAPTRLPELIARIRSEGPPLEPIDAAV